MTSNVIVPSACMAAISAIIVARKSDAEDAEAILKGGERKEAAERVGKAVRRMSYNQEK
jgi:hypothetical protein